MRFYNYFRRASIAAAIALATACEATTSPEPSPRGSIVITANAGDIYQGDALALTATVRDADGEPMPGAVVTWTTSDNSVVELSPAGVVTALEAGVARVTARSGELTATRDLSVQALTVQLISILGLPDTVGSGDVTTFGVSVLGEGGRRVTGRKVTLATADPAVAIVDPSGRVRAVGPGSTSLIVTVDGVFAAQPIVVSSEPAVLILRRLGDSTLPVLIAADTVEWNGVKEYGEVYLESGELQLSGGQRPRYKTALRYAQYAVSTEGGQRRLELRAVFHDRDRGVVNYDPRGELAMDSELVAPLAHLASPETSGMSMRYKVAGEDRVLSLFFRREPK